MRQLFLDTETTGLDPQKDDRVVEIACVEMVNRKLTGRHWHVYLNPERPMPEAAFNIHGLGDEFLADKPLFASQVDAFLEFVVGAELIIHNAPFDVGFLDMELARVGKPALASAVKGVLDSLAMAKQMYPGKRNSLDALCDRLEVDRSGRTLHGGLLDAELLAEVYLRLTRGQDALISSSHAAEPGLSEVAADFTGLDLPVLLASEAELAAHAEVIQQIDKASNGKTVWR
jgi:DNA polymerase III subunit epsilon